MSEEGPRLTLSPAVREQIERQKRTPEPDVADRFDPTSVMQGYRAMIDHFNRHFEFGYDIVDIRTETPADGYNHYRVVMEAEGLVRPRSAGDD